MKRRSSARARRVLEPAHHLQTRTTLSQGWSFEMSSDCFAPRVLPGSFSATPGAAAAATLWHSGCIALTASIDRSRCPAAAVTDNLNSSHFKNCSMGN